MKGICRTIVLGIITALILVVNGFEAGSVLEPDPSPLAAAAMISAQQHESLTSLVTVPKTARRSITKCQKPWLD